jgi:hypothetical protein
MLSFAPERPAISGNKCYDGAYSIPSLFYRDGHAAYVDRELMMTVHASKLLTPEEFASLIEIAIASDNPTVPPHHMLKLISLGYVLETAKGPRVTGDGLIRITESE